MRRTHIQAILFMVCMGLSLCLTTQIKAGIKKDTNTYTAENNTAERPDIEVSVGYVHTLIVGQTFVPFSVNMNKEEDESAGNSVESTETGTEVTVLEENVTEEVTEVISIATETTVPDETEDTIHTSVIKEQTECETEVTMQASGNNGAKVNNRWNISLTDEEIDLLARIVWVEARGECREGQIAVVEVIFNRVYSGGFSDTLYGVLSQKNQFESWKIRNSAKEYESQVEVVKEVIAGNTNVLPMNVMYFAMSPLGNDIVTVIGNHYFTTDWQYPKNRKY